ncbi:GNAT family N-acetyltransferase [uncultured Microscilla sp.]|uniref:GNAT family N-acetyltransferase n=1 Tax=uncultured Microscilla sp. TaxID=432653 RepID=UPI002632CF65|nr:GNAT family N-acetyltransferase [uncultured Microscilla sp.]
MNLKNYYEGLASERLTFRRLTLADADDWLEFYYNNDSLKYLGINLNRTPKVMAKAWITTQIERYEKNEYGQLAMIHKRSNRLIGTRGFKLTRFRGQYYVESAGSVKPRYWRQGYGFESAACMYDYVFSQSNNNMILGYCHLNNVASAKNLQKLGFVEVENQYTLERTVVMYKLLRSVWQKRKR